MSQETFDTVKRVAAEILPDRQTRVSAEGEDYYSFEASDSQGMTSTLPRVWIAPGSSDNEIRNKLRHEFRLAFDPDSEPDDLSVPGLATEGRRYLRGPGNNRRG
jgi:hypothetical protein